MRIGIVGLPYSGKTTFFTTITETRLDPEAFQKKDANVATVKVADDRLDKLTKIFNPKKKINAAIEVVDLAGVQKGDAQSASFDSEFLGKVKSNDALILVVRGFKDETVPHVDGEIDIVRDVKTLQDEFAFADMAFIESRLDKIQKDINRPKTRDKALKEKEYIEKWNEALQEEIPLRDVAMTEDELLLAKNYQPLTAKPMIVALNLDESDVARADQITAEVMKHITGKHIVVEPFFAKIEMELAQLDDEEKEMFTEEYGIKESALSRTIRSAYDLLGLQSFFTVGEDECRAWTIKKGAAAQEAAGAIHTDFYNKFIRAEVVSYQEFVDRGSFQKCKEDGVFRLEGKSYIVQDGDILHVRHG